MKSFMHIQKNEIGASMIEYGLLLSLLCVTAIPAISYVGGNTDTSINQAANAIAVSQNGEPLGSTQSNGLLEETITDLIDHGPGWHRIGPRGSLTVPEFATGTRWYTIYSVSESGEETRYVFLEFGNYPGNWRLMQTEVLGGEGEG